MPRPTHRGWGFLVVTAGTYLSARLVGTWELYLLAFAFLAVFAVSWTLVLLAGRRLRVSREIVPLRPLAGDEVRLTFRAVNASVLSGLQVTLHDAVESLDGLGVRVEFEGLPSRGSRTVQAEPWIARRGVYHLPAPRAVAEDPLGLTCVRRIVGESQDLTVYPRLADLSACLLVADDGRRRGRGRRGLPASGSVEFRGIRPHNPGEPLSRVDWKATARTGTLMLREMDDPAAGDFAIALDGSAARLVGEPPDTSFELAVRAVGSLAACALRAGRVVTLFLQDDAWRPVRLSPHGDGRRRLLERLARVKTHRSTPTPPLQDLLASRASFPRARMLTLVVQDLDDRLARSMIALRETGLEIAAVRIVAESFGAAAPDRRPLALGLQAAGIRCVDLRRGDDLQAALSAAPSRRMAAPSR